jgi:hypothetical protein
MARQTPFTQGQSPDLQGTSRPRQNHQLPQIKTMTPLLKTFLATGQKPSSEQARNAILDESRSVILKAGEIAIKRGEVMASAKIQLPTLERMLPPKPAPRTAATSTATAPVKATGPKLTTAEEFGINPLTMLRSEFEKLTASDRMRFCKDGGKLV